MWTWLTSWFNDVQQKDPEQFEMFEIVEKENVEPCVCQIENSKSLPCWVKEQYLSKTKEPKEIVSCTIPLWAQNEYQWAKENEKMLLHYEFQSLNKRYSKYFHPISSSAPLPPLIDSFSFPIQVNQVNPIHYGNHEFFYQDKEPLIYDEIDQLLFQAMITEKENEILRIIYDV